MSEWATKLIDWRKRWLELLDEQRTLINRCRYAGVPTPMVASMLGVTEKECENIYEQTQYKD